MPVGDPLPPAWVPASWFKRAIHPEPRRRNALVRARIDLARNSGCALIEEIQPDWVRRTAWLGAQVARQRLIGQPANAPARYRGLRCPLETAATCRHLIHQGCAAGCSAAMLWASIVFVQDELGLRDIACHGAESGVLLKLIQHHRLPRSLHSDLSHCLRFSRTEEIPPLLERQRRVGRILKGKPGRSFYRLNAGSCRPRQTPDPGAGASSAGNA